jgi:hypothetical protein
MKAKLIPAVPAVTVMVPQVVSEAVPETVDLLGLSRKQARDIMVLLGATNDHHLPESEDVYNRLKDVLGERHYKYRVVMGDNIGVRLFRIE